MARIPRSDHDRILHMVDVERRRVADIAADWGCTPANIYALCRLRRAGRDATPAPAETPTPAPSPPATDLFAPPTNAPKATLAEPTPARATQPPKRDAPQARPARPGYGLAMRTADGEENLAPFRSLDELLTAIKPVLRNAARSPDPVWFSIQPIDLAAVDLDAA